MENKHITRKNGIASAQTLLMIFTIAAVSFACGFYLASAQIAAMLNN